MDRTSSQWRSLGEPASPAEAAALDALRELLPDDAVTHAWANVSFIDHGGRISEADVILLTRSGLYVVELKGWGDGKGRVAGDQQNWRVTFDSGYLRHERNPVFTTDMKAKRLKALLQSAGRGGVRIPYVGALVVMHGRDSRVELDSLAQANVVALDGFGVKGLKRRFSEFLATPPSHPSNLVDGPAATKLARLLTKVGFQPTPKNRFVGQYSLEKADPLGQGPHWQDLRATHPSMPGVQRRLRLFDMKPGASDEARELIRSAARREFMFTHGSEHPGITAPIDLVESDLGPALIFDFNEDEVPLESYLAEHGAKLGLDERLHLVRQIADTLRYAHARKLVHRALTPAQVYVRELDGVLRVSVRDWQTGRRTQGTTTAQPVSPTATSFGVGDVRDMLAHDDWVYLAPEAHQHLADVPPVPLDVFGLGAISYLILTGEAPAKSLAELQGRLETHGHLDPHTADSSVPEDLAEVVRMATARVESDRLASVQDFLDLLDHAEEALTAPDSEDADDRKVAKDPLDATRGEFIAERFEVLERRGTGSTGTALLVSDYERDGPAMILKIAKDDAAAQRLALEADVLAGLHHPRLVNLVEGPIEVDGRQALVLSDAGAQTLASHLESRGRATLRELENFGTDLLEAVAYLDGKGVFHRDIKPANLGVRPDPGTRRPSLVLFDLSLAREPLEHLESGTRGYMDPYLQFAGKARRRYDRAAELYAVAITLYEMATQDLPFWTEGNLAPLSMSDRVFLAADRFEASVAPQLVEFFSRALAPEPAERFGDFEAMARAWQAIFTSVDAGADHPEDEAARDERARSATLDTPLDQAGFTARALSALGRLQARTVGELIATPPMHINGIPGLGEQHRKEIQRRVRDWRARLASGASTQQVQDSQDRSLEAFLTARVPRRTSKNATEVAALRLVLGLPLALPGEVADGDAVRAAEEARAAWGSWPTAAAVASVVGVTRPRVAQILDAAGKRWIRSQEVREAATELAEVLEAEQGVATVDEVAATLLLRHGSTADGADRMRRARGLVRVILETDGHRAQPELVLRQQSNGPALIALASYERDGVALTADALLETAQGLAGEVRSLLKEQKVVPAATAREALRAKVGAEHLDDDRLLRLATAATDVASLSGFHELYRSDLDHGAAVEVALRGLSVAALTEAGVRRRVQARFPSLAPLPGRPALDGLVGAALPGMTWDGARYTRAGVTAAQASSSTHTALAAEAPAVVDGQLRQSLRLSTGQILRVRVRRYLAAVDALAAAYGVRVVDVASELYEAIRARAERDDVDWDVVLRTDGQRRRGAPPSAEWPYLRALVHDAFEEWWVPLAAEPTPLLLTNAGVLARYELLHHISTLLDQASVRPAARWVLVPRRDGQRVPMLDGEQVPLGAARWIELPEDLESLKTGDVT